MGPHCASLVRDDGGGFSHWSFKQPRASMLLRHCERSEAIHPATTHEAGLLRCARNDGCGEGTQTLNVVIPRCAIHIADAPRLDAAHRPGMTAVDCLPFCSS